MPGAADVIVDDADGGVVGDGEAADGVVGEELALDGSREGLAPGCLFVEVDVRMGLADSMGRGGAGGATAGFRASSLLALDGGWTLAPLPTVAAGVAAGT